jgi:hypothetical protein
MSPGQTVHQNGGVQPFHIVALIDIGAPPGGDDIVFQLNPQWSPVEDALQSAVDFGAGKHKATSFAKRDQLIQGGCWHRTTPVQ